MLPYDICRCAAKLAPCKDKDRCARHTSPGRTDGWQSVIDASELRLEDKCGMFIDNGDVSHMDSGSNHG